MKIGLTLSHTSTPSQPAKLASMQRYIDTLADAGAEAVPLWRPRLDDERKIAARADKLASQLDGVLVTGGKDLHPSLYGQAVNPDAKVNLVNPLRTTFEGQLVRAMRERDLVLAHQKIEELVTYQFSMGQPTHVAKSLCTLATEAQRLELYALQAELTDGATQAAPDDVWSWTQRGKSLLNTGDLARALEAYDRAQSLGGDAVVKCGRADVLKSLGRFDDALQAYEAAARQHPEGVVAKCGRAEVLKSLGRFDDALQAYDNAVCEHPESTVAKTGRACILAAIGRPDEALLSVTEGRPITENEWVSYHVRGMILLRKGNMDEAIAIFEDGQKNNPFVLDRDYFRTALVVARLHKRQYAAAAEVLAQIKLPRFQAQADLLRVHAFGVQSRFDEASAAFSRLPPPSSSVVRELVEELHRRFVAQGPPEHDDDWLLQHEIDSCLLAA